MSSAVTCPKCRKAVSMPAEADSAAWVRCPLCLAKFELQKALDIKVPMLEVIDAPPGAHLAGVMDAPDAVESSLEELPFDAPPISSAAMSAMSAESAGDKRAAAAAGTMDLGEDEDTLPAMEAGSLSPMSSDSSAGGMPDYHETHGFREAPGGDVEESGVLELQPEADAGEWRSQPPVMAGDVSAVGVKSKTARRKKRSRNPVVEAVKIVVGSALGLAIGYSVLMWGFKKDPFKLAEILPQAIVPSSLQPAYRVARTPTLPPRNATDPWVAPSMGDDTTDATADPMADTPMEETPMQLPLDANDGALPGVDPTPPAEPAPSPSTTPAPMPTPEPLPPEPSTTTPSPSEPITPQPTPLEPTPTEPPSETKPPVIDLPMPSPTPSPMPDSATLPDSTPPPPPSDPGLSPFPTPMPPPEDPPVGPKSDTKFTLEQVNHAMTAAHKSAKAFESAPPDLAEADLKKLRVACFRGFADLAEAVTLVGDKADNAKAARAAALTMLQSVANDMPKLNQIGKLGGAWITSKYRKGNGVVLAGRVQETTPVGKLFRTQLQLLGHDQPTSIFVVTAEEPPAKTQEIVVLLGTIVGVPALNLHDYEGAEDIVIWASAIGPAQMDTPTP